MMPLLPPPDLFACNLGDATRFWDTKSIIAYGQQCREAALEDAAVAVLSLKATSSDWCAEKIRSLKK